MRVFNATIEGVSPGLLQHKFPDIVAEQLDNPVKPKLRQVLSREEEAELFAYRLKDGRLCQPGEHIFQALIKAAAAFQIQGGKKLTYKDAVKGGVLIEPEFISHEVNVYLIDSRPVVINRGRIIRHRPHLPTWTLTFDLQVIEDGIPAEVLKEILIRAGEKIGIGNYRPRFGRFVVTSFQQV